MSHTKLGLRGISAAGVTALSRLAQEKRALGTLGSAMIWSAALSRPKSSLSRTLRHEIHRAGSKSNISTPARCGSKSRRCNSNICVQLKAVRVFLCGEMNITMITRCTPGSRHTPSPVRRSRMALTLSYRTRSGVSDIRKNTD